MCAKKTGKTSRSRSPKVYIAVGSNIAPEQHITFALVRVAQAAKVTALSTVYHTEPLRRPEQPHFLNCVWRIETDVPARDLKYDVLRPIEAALGRVRKKDRFAAREIDLDVILYGDEVVDEPDLTLPDPDIRTRPFVAVPLLELAPRLKMPDDGATLNSIVKPMDISTLKPETKFTQQLKEKLALWTNSV